MSKPPAPTTPFYNWTQGAWTGASPYWLTLANNGVAFTNSNLASVYKSSDFGATWALNYNVGGRQVSCSAATGDKVAYAVPGPDYTRYSTNTGTTWSTNSTRQDRWQRLVLSPDGSRMIAATNGQGTLYATGVSGSWALSNYTNNSGNVLCLSNAGIALMLDGSNIIQRSTNYGATWGAVSGTSNTWSGITLSESGYAYATGGSAIYRSTNNGSTWTIVPGTSSISWGEISTCDSGQFVIVTRSSSVIHVSSDYGNTFVATNSPILTWSYIVMSRDGLHAIAADQTTNTIYYANA